MDFAGLVEAAATDAGFDMNAEDASSDDISSSSDDTPSDGAESSDDSAPATEAPAAPVPTATTEPSEEDDLKALEAELTQKTPALAKGKMPVARSQAILERARRRHEAEVTELRGKYARYDDPVLQQKLAALDLAERDHETYFQRLTSLPQYKALLDRALAAQAPKPEAKAPAADEMPAPNSLMADGSLGYDAAGQQKLLEWRERQLRTEFDKALDKRLGEVNAKIEPWVRAEEAQKRTAALIAEVTPVLESARRWPGFRDHENDIQAEMAKPTYEGLSAQQALERAYDAVVPGKMKLAEEQKIANLKAEWVKELNAKTRGRTAAAPGSAAPAGEAAPRTIHDIVREAAAAANDD